MDTAYVPVSGSTREAVIRELAEYAINHDLAEDGYTEAVLEREQSYPTGLSIPDEDFGIAIPHADPDHVLGEAVLLALPEEPVEFQSMDNPDIPVAAEAVLLLLAAESDEYTRFLSNLANLFQDTEFPKTVREGDADRVLALIEERCL